MQSRLALMVLTTLFFTGVLSNHWSTALADPPHQESKPSGDANRNLEDVHDPLPNGAIARLGSIRFRPGTGVDGLGLSSDGSTLISIGKQVMAWDSETGKELWRENGGQSSRSAGYCCSSIAFAKNRSRFYTVSDASQVLVWNAEKGFESAIQITGRPDDRGVNLPKGKYSIDVTADGSRFAVGGPGELVICDGDGNVQFTVKSGHNNPRNDDQNDRLAFVGPYTYGRFSPNGEIVAVVTSDRPREIRLFDVSQHTESYKIEVTAKVVQLCFSPDGKKIATTERDSAVRLYDVASATNVWSKVFQLMDPFENYTSVIDFNPQGNLLAVGATDNRIHLIDATDGRESGLLIGHAWYPWCLVFTADGRTLYSSGWEGVIRRWDVENGKERPLSVGIRGSAVVAASTDGKLIACCDNSSVIHLLDSASRQEQRTLTHATPGWSRVAFSRDSRYLVAGGSQGEQMHAAIWDVTNGKLHREWEWPKGDDPHSSVEAIEFSANGDRLAVAVFRQSRIMVWDLTRDVEGAQLLHDHVYGLSFSPDGKTLASVGWDKTIRFWNVDAGKADKINESSTTATASSRLVETGNSFVSLSRELQIPDEKGDERMYAICCSHDSIASAHLDGTVRIWNPEPLVVKRKFNVPGRFVFGAVRFSPDGQWLATGAMAGDVILWEPWTGKKAYTVGRHDSHVYTVGFGRDNRTMVSGGSDRVSYIWKLVPSPADREQDLKSQWAQLSDSDSEIAYRTMWGLTAAHDQAVSLIAEKLRPVHTVFDIDHDDESQSQEENDRRKRMKRISIDKDSGVESEVVVRRAVSVLKQIGSKESVALLKELATADADGSVGRYARAMLKD